MMFSKRNSHWLGMAVVGIVAVGVIAALFPGVVKHPDDYFFLNAGDGLKAYFATTYYVQHDAGLHFSGMNYPYGEHINYPDLQPLLAVGLWLLKQLGLPVAGHVVGATNLAALLGLALTPVILYAILRRLRLPVWYAGLLALLIGFMSPQIERLGGHMSLSYSCFVPFIWYCLIRIQEMPGRIRWYVVFGVSSLLMAGTSVYFLACASFFALAHVPVLWWQRRPVALLWRLALAALLPLLMFRSWLWLTDAVADRPQIPYGFLAYLSSMTTVFTPVMAPVRDLWQALFHTETANFEGWSYVGLVAAAVAVVSVVRLVGKLLRRRWAQVVRPVLPLPLWSGLWAATLLLLLAFGWPFKFAAFEWLVNYAGPLRQFRALGRFAWPFFYVFSTYAAYYLFRVWRHLQQHGVGGFATSWLAILLLIWAGEAYIQISTKADAVVVNTGAVEYMAADKNPTFQQLSWSGRQASDFQAILSLPFFSIGTDKTDLSGSESSIRESFRLSLASGLPLVASQMTRSSVGHALAGLQLISSSLVEKTGLAAFPSHKPLLLLVTNDALTPGEQRLVTLAHKLGSTPQTTLYELPFDALAATTIAAENTKAATLLPTLPEQPGGLYTTTGKGAVYRNFDNSNAHRGRLGAGAFYEPAATISTLYDGPLPTPADTGRYEAAVWINGKMSAGYGNMQVKLYDAGGQMIDQQVTDARHATEVQGDWLRVEVPFRRTAQAVRLEVLYDSGDLLADDLLVRPVDTDIYYYLGTGDHRQIVKNTYPLAP